MRFAVQFPQKDFIARVPSSKMVVLCDMQTWIPQSAHVATACPLHTEHLAILFDSYLAKRTVKLPLNPARFQWLLTGPDWVPLVGCSS